MNTKSSPLLFLDTTIRQNNQQENELGRIFIEPLQQMPATQDFMQIFSRVQKGFLEQGRSSIDLAKLTEAKRNAFIKFTFDVANVDNLTNGQFEKDATTTHDSGTASQQAQPTFTTEPNGVVIFNTSNPQRPAFYILTSSWSAQGIQGDIVGVIFKGMELVNHMSWLNVDAENNVTENCVVADMGVIPTGYELGIKQRESVLDPSPDLPTDSDLDYHDFENVLKVAFKIKASGSLLFRQERYQMARFRFGKAVRYLGWATERQKISLEQEIKALQIIVPCILNSAACRLKLHDFDGALEDCNEAMELCPNNPKAYFRRGQAHHGKMNYEKSLNDLYMALKLSPNDRAIKNEIAAVEGEMQVYKKVPSRRNSEETAMQIQ